MPIKQKICDHKSACSLYDCGSIACMYRALCLSLSLSLSQFQFIHTLCQRVFICSLLFLITPFAIRLKSHQHLKYTMLNVSNALSGQHGISITMLQPSCWEHEKPSYITFRYGIIINIPIWWWCWSKKVRTQCDSSAVSSCFNSARTLVGSLVWYSLRYLR